MASNDTTESHHTAIIGSNSNFWLYDSRSGFDLTHPSHPDVSIEGHRLTIQTTTSAITIDPAKSALVIIDMQNLFLSPALHQSRGPGHEALDQLVEHAIPAARKARAQVIWLNWGLTEEDIDKMPPSQLRISGFEGQRAGESVTIDKNGNLLSSNGDNADKARPKRMGTGSDMGTVTDPATGKKIQVGKLFMRDQWCSALFPPLDRLYEEGSKLKSKPDVWIHKDRMSGAWTQTPFIEFLEKNEIRTLMFTGVNTDQCVLGTYFDCFNKGFDCILLADGCGTVSGDFAKKTVEFNASNFLGYQTSCKALSEGVDKMII